MVANPHCGCELRGVSNEPGVEVVLTGSGLTRSWVIGELRTTTGARTSRAADVLFQHRGDLACGLWGDGSEWLWIVLEHDLATLGYSLDKEWLDTDSVVSDRGVGVGHFEWRDVEHAERQCRNRRDVILNTECSSGVDHVVQADQLTDSEITTVGRAKRVLLDRQIARAAPTVVIACGIDGRIATGVIEGAWRRGVDSVARDQATVFDCGGQCEGLERRTGRPAVLGGDVELELFKARSTDHGSNSAGARLYRNEARNDAEFVLWEFASNRVLGQALGCWVERGVDLQTTLEHGVDTISAGLAEARIVEKATLDLFNEVGVEECVAFDLAVARQFAGFPHCSFFRVDEAFGLQTAQCNTAAIECVVRSIHRVIEARVRDHAGEQCGLAIGQGVCVFVEVELCGCLHAVGAATEVHGVQVALKDLVLGHLLFEAHRDGGLRDLAVEVLFATDNAELYELLGDGRTTLLDATGGHVGDRGTGDRTDVDAAVFIEAVIFDSQDRFDDARRDVAERQVLAVDLRTELRYELAVGIEDLGGLFEHGQVDLCRYRRLRTPDVGERRDEGGQGKR